MFPRSLILLASAGAVMAQVAPECEHLTDVAALLNTDDGKTYCSAVRDIGTTTETVVESATATETTTITTPSQVTLSITTTQTDTVTEGFVTETAATATATETVTESSTVYSCTTALKRREYGEAQSTSCTKGKTTSTPTPSSTSCTKSKTSSTPTPIVTSTSCTEGKGQQHATSAAYGASQPAYSQGAASSVQGGYYGSDASKAAYPSKAAEGSYSAPLYTDSGVKVYPTAGAGYYHNSSSAAYPTAGASSAHYDSYEEYPTTSSIYEQISSLISSYAGYPTISSSVYYSSEIASSSVSDIVSSSIYTPSPTPTPTPVPSCEAAPSAVQTGYGCDEIYSACGCLGLASATAQVTATTTLTEAVSVTEAMLFTTTTQLTETVFTTVPATTTVTPSVTVTTTATATATVCPCTSSQTLCGSTPDTCKDLQNDANNCGTCGNVCNSGQCSAGKCLDCVPRTCQTFSLGRCNNAGLCYCVTGSTGKPLCGDLSVGNCGSYKKCDADSNCGSGQICTKDTCCGYGICISVNSCGNPQNAKRMFQPRGKSANELIGF